MRNMIMPTLLLLTVVIMPGLLAAGANEGSASDISLETLLNTKVSAAAKYEQTASEAPASITIITSEDIERYGYRTLEEAFQSVRGFYITYDRDYAYLGVRGFGRPSDYNNRVLLLLNGHTLNENVFGAAAVGTDLALNLDSVERIEIVRGSGSALYGTEAMLAVINVITKRANTSENLKLSAETGSYGRFLGSTTLGKEFDNGMDLFVSGVWADVQGQDLYFREFDDPSTNNGVAENLDNDKYYGVLTTFEYGDIALQGMISSRNKKVPTAPFASVFNGDVARSEDRRKFVELKYDHAIQNDKNILLRAYYDDYNRLGAFMVPRELGGFTLQMLGTDEFEGDWLGGEAQFRWDLQSNNRLIVGTEYQNHLRASDAITALDSMIFRKDVPFTVFSYYLQEEYQASHNLSLTVGIRLDNYSTVGNSFTPRGAIVYNPFKSGTAKLLYGEAFRAPNLFEIAFGAPIPNAKSNPNLKPEKIRTMEIVWEQRLSNQILGVITLFSNKMRDLIDKTIDPSDFLFQYRNISNVNTRGLELDLNARLKTGFHAYANYSYQHVEDADSKKKLTNSPSHLLKIGLSYPALKHIYVAAEVQYESERITIYNTKTEPFLVTNFKLSSGLLLNHMKSSLLVRNLFDVNYATPGGFEHLQPAIPQDGRNLTFLLEYEL